MQDLKKDKTIILTTHAMEEADALADRIAVVVDGKLKCVGTPLNMKNTFGDGYRVSMVCELGNESTIISHMDVIAPSNKFVDDSGGSMVFTVPLNAPHEISPLFRLIDTAGAEEFKYDKGSDSY
jgi:ABC-type multidrug transport system ATPase subunit